MLRENNTFEELVRDIYALFNRYNINEHEIATRYSSGEASPDETFLRELAHLFAAGSPLDHWRLAVHSRRLAAGVNFLLRHPKVGISQSSDQSPDTCLTDVATKKSLVFSTNWVMVFPGWLSYEHGKRKKGSISYNPEFLQYLAKYKTLILDRRLAFAVPEHAVDLYDPENGDIGHVVSSDPLGIYTSHPKPLPEGLFVVDLRHDTIRKMFAEQDLGVFAVDIILPQVGTMPVETLMKVRDDEAESLIRFQQAVREFLTNSAACPSEKLIIEMLMKVDSEVRALEARFQSLRKKRLIEATTLAMGLAGMTLCLLAPQEIVKYIAAVFGASKASNLIRFLLEHGTYDSELRMSPFYIPWKLSKLSK